MAGTAKLEFWFDFASTYSYLSAMRIKPLTSAAGITLHWKPFLLGPVFAAQGWNTSPFNIYEAKGRYMWRDVERQAEHYGLPFRRPTEFPQFTMTATRVAVAADAEPWLGDFCRAVFHREYDEGGDIAAPQAVTGVLERMGIDPSSWLTAAQDPAVKQALKDRVTEAGERGIFGAPTFVCPDGELFWGDDRLQQAIAWAVQSCGTSPS